MLALSPLRSGIDEDLESFSNGGGGGGGEFSDFCEGNVLLESIDFDELFVGINDDDDVLPDLEMDPEILAEFSVSGGGEESQSQMTTSASFDKIEESSRNEEFDVTNSGSDFGFESSLIQGDQQQEVVVSKRDHEIGLSKDPTANNKQGEKGRKSSSHASKNPQGKRKVKVDWTPELHRRFVQAVEQLGVDKAVPSRILELMGIDCLTRHNIASHLQKYRSHRKHLLAREAEAANWTQRRQLYCGPGGGKRDMNPWHAIAPTIGFPPPPPPPLPHFRPLHVWGHPSITQTRMHVWPKHLGPSPPPAPSWTPAPSHPPPPTPPPDPSLWHSHHLRVPNSLTPGTPCFPPHLAHARFPTTPVPGIPTPTMYKMEPGIGVPTAASGQSPPQPPLDFHPSKESIDAAIGDVLSKPWLPLPLGLKPPSVDGVLVELQRQGIPKIPPAGG